MGVLGRKLFNSRWRAHSQARTITPTFLRLGGSLTDNRVLEVGCGCGVGTELILRAMNASTVDAIDIDPIMVALAVRRVTTHAAVILADIGSLPVGDCSYDAVVDFGALHLADAWGRQIREIARVLRPGGRFFFEQPVNPGHRWAIDRPGGGRLPGGFGQEELVDGIHSAGLSTIGLSRIGLGRLDLIGVAQKK